MTATPILDAATVSRFTVQDFPLTPSEQDTLSTPSERYRLEECLRRVVDFDAVAASAAELWRTGREA